jgi:hypothetical protein
MKPWKEKTMLSLIPRDFIQSLVRHALTVLGGALMAKGYGDAVLVEGLVGVGVTASGLVWSYVSKTKPPPGREPF